MSGGRSRWLGNLGAMVFGVVFALVLAEAALRVSGYVPASIMADSTLGTRWHPGSRYRVKVEGFSEGRINSQGWRDHEYALDKPAGTTRLLFLGDSYVQATEVALDSTFHKRLERDLDRQSGEGRRFEVIALGRSGLGTAEELLTYRRWGRRYQPDVVGLLFINNDWSDNWNWPGSDLLRPYLIESGDSLRLDDSFLRSRGYRRLAWTLPIKRASSLMTIAADSWQRWRASTHPTVTESGLTGERGWYESWNFDRSPAADSVPAMRRTARILTELAREVRANGSRFVVFVAGAAENQDRSLLAQRAQDPNFDPGKVDRWLSALGAREGFPVVSLAGPFRTYSATGAPRPCFGKGRNFGHWNERGHAIVSQAMLEWWNTRPQAGGADSLAASR